MADDGGTVSCPHCAEPIQAAARKCKHCGEWRQKRPTPQQSATAYIVSGVAFLSSVVGFLTNFTNEGFSLIQLLVEIGSFGFALYVALIPSALAVVALLHNFPELEQNHRALAGLALAIALLLGAAIRFGLFAEGLTTNLDAFGTFFTAFVGAAVVFAGFWVAGRFRGVDTGG